MRYIACLLVGLLLWNLVDDFLVSDLRESSRALANDDDEYLRTVAKPTAQRLAKQEKTSLCVANLDGAGRATVAGASLSFSCPDLRAFGCVSRLYVFMSLQI